MTTYIALLRGINVSGQKIIKMADLRALCQKMGFSNVQTYIQSGNILLQSELTADQIAEKISNGIKQSYGFEVPIMVITPEELRQAKSKNPYLGDSHLESNKLYFTFLSAEPTEERIKEIDFAQFEPAQCTILGKVFYLHVPEGYGNTKLDNNFFEKKLQVRATTRNLRTVNKLIEMTAAM